MNLTPELMAAAIRLIPEGAYPGILADIRRVAGPGVALTLVAHKGGKKVSIPKTLKPDHWLAVLVGKKAATLIVEAIGGDMFDIPKMTNVLRHHLAIHLVVERRMSRSKVAEILDMTHGRVTTITKHVTTLQPLITTRGHHVQNCPACRRPLRHVRRLTNRTNAMQLDLFERIKQ
jgi:hypothetical protein